MGIHIHQTKLDVNVKQLLYKNCFYIVFSKAAVKSPVVKQTMVYNVDISIHNILVVALNVNVIVFIISQQTFIATEKFSFHTGDWEWKYKSDSRITSKSI